MRKSMVCAMSVIMAAGTFQVAAAAANPFSDVPQDHWAYDAVAQLAKDGVIDGYGDGRYQGERNITRYEMAQMVAKAMAKTNVSSTDKSMIDKLSAEFADELNNLGVRVAKLERNADQVKFTGEARYTYNSVRHTYKDRANSNNFLLRLEPTAEVNDHWQVKARIDSTVDMKSSETTENAKLKRIWAQGNYSNFTVKLGKIPCFSQPSQGMIMDTELSGGQVTFGNVLKTTLTAGRYNQDQPNLKTTGNYRSAELLYDAGGRFTAGAAYYYIGNSSLYHYFTTVNADAAKIWQAGMGWRFSPSVSAYANYSRDTEGHTIAELRRAWSVELDYKKAVPSQKGSFGAFAAYRSLGDIAVVTPTYDGITFGQKGWDMGMQYVPMENILLKAAYFHGKDIERDTTASTLFGRIEYFF